MDINGFQPIVDKSNTKHNDTRDSKQMFHDVLKYVDKTLFAQAVQPVRKTDKHRKTHDKQDVEKGDGMVEDSIESLSESQLVQEVKKRIQRLNQLKKHFLGF